MKDNRLRKYAEVATIFIAVLALTVSIWDRIETRKHNRLSVVPHLDIVRRYSGLGEKGLYIENNGLGPAIIRSVIINYSDSVIDFSSAKDLTSLLVSLQLDTVAVTFLRDGYLFKKESTEGIITINTDYYKFERDTLILKKFREFTHICVIFLNYESIYGDEFIKCSPSNSCKN